MIKIRHLLSEDIALIGNFERDFLKDKQEKLRCHKFKSFIPKALEIFPLDDFPYIALALFLESEGHNVRILSNDKSLLKSLSKIGIKGITIHDLLRELKLV